MNLFKVLGHVTCLPNYFIFLNCLILILTYHTYFIVLFLLSISLFHSVQTLLSIKPLQFTDRIWQPPTDKILPLLNKTKCCLAIFDYMFDQAIIETQRNEIVPLVVQPLQHSLEVAKALIDLLHSRKWEVTMALLQYSGHIPLLTGCRMSFHIGILHLIAFL